MHSLRLTLSQRIPAPSSLSCLTRLPSRAKTTSSSSPPSHTATSPQPSATAAPAPASSSLSSFETECVKVEQVHPGLLRGVNIPIVPSTTFELSDVAHGAALSAEADTPTASSNGFIYSRISNPTSEAVARSVAKLEGAHEGGARLFSSGMAAMTSALTTALKKGDHVVAPLGIYGGVREFLDLVAIEKMGVQVTFVNASNFREYEEAIRPNTAVLLAETPCNPTMRLTSLHALGALRLAHGKCISIVDSTFASPYNQQPLSIPGIDVVVHSATKYLGGHSDVLAGAVISKSLPWMIELGKMQKINGAVLSPFDSYLLGRGLKTLAVRMQRINQSALALASFLSNHPKIAAVHYPGLASHPDHHVAVKQMSGYGGMIAFEVQGGIRAARTLVQGLKVAVLAVSLGGAESLVCHAASTTHNHMDPLSRQAAGITDGLIRFSTGLESIHDLTADFEQALSKL